MAPREFYLKWERQFQQDNWPSAVPSSMIITDNKTEIG